MIANAIKSKEEFMSYLDDWRAAIFAAPDLTTLHKLVALAIAQHADWHTGADAFPSNARLISMCSSSQASVTRSRRALITAGFIHAQPAAGPGGTTLCRLTLPEQAHIEATTPAAVPATIPTRQAPAHTATVEPAPSLSSPATPKPPPAQLAATPEAQRSPDVPYEDAIRQGFRAVGGACTYLSKMHLRLIHAAKSEGWSPDRLRDDVIANLKDYAKRGVSHTPLMLVHDMGTRSIEAPTLHSPGRIPVALDPDMRALLDALPKVCGDTTLPTMY